MKVSVGTEQRVVKRVVEDRIEENVIHIKLTVSEAGRLLEDIDACRIHSNTLCDIATLELLDDIERAIQEING